MPSRLDARSHNDIGSQLFHGMPRLISIADAHKQLQLCAPLCLPTSIERRLPLADDSAPQKVKHDYQASPRGI